MEYLIADIFNSMLQRKELLQAGRHGFLGFFFFFSLILAPLLPFGVGFFKRLNEMSINT